MCPACIGTAALIYTAMTSAGAGGITALVVKNRRSKPANRGVAPPIVNAGEPDRSPRLANPN